MSSLKMGRGGALKILGEALAGYAFGIGGIIAGTIIVLQLEVFREVPWSMAVYPAVLSARGIIGGLLGGRLSTALHLGTIFPRIFKNTKTFHTLFDAVVTLTFEISFIMSLFSTFFGSLLWGISLAVFPIILIIILATMALGLLIALITISISFISFKHGLDPDIFLYPAVSAMSDVIITSFYIIVLSTFTSSNIFGQWFLVSLGLLLVVLALYNLIINFKDVEFIRTLKESFLTLIFVSVIVTITGTILNSIRASISNTGSLISEGAVYRVFPALMAIIGAVGAIVGSTATTKLAVGLLDVAFSDVRRHLMEILCAWVASLIMFVFFSLLSLTIHGTLTLQYFMSFTLLLFITNVIAAFAIIFISYAIALVTFQRGLDPDNFVIPIESVLADSVTLLALLVALFLVG